MYICTYAQSATALRACEQSVRDLLEANSYVTQVYIHIET